MRYGASLAGRSGMVEEVADCPDDDLEPLVSEAREQRQREEFPRERFRHRERTAAMAEMRERLRQVDWDGIVKTGLDPSSGKKPGEGVAMVGTDLVEVP